MGLFDGKICREYTNAASIRQNIAEQILSQSTEIVTIITGEDTSDDEVDALQQWLEEQFQTLIDVD